MFGRIAVLALLAGAAGVAVFALPELKRYLRIRSM